MLVTLGKTAWATFMGGNPWTSVSTPPFPFEAGVAFVGAPSVKANLTGWACYDPALTQCTDVNSKTDPIALDIQSNLQTQVDKWAHDVEWLKTYPIASFGVAYSFALGNRNR